MKPRPLFSSLLLEHPKRSTLAIGQTEASGPVVCYILEEEGQHSELSYIYTGRDSYQMWRSYMKKLGEWEREKDVSRFEHPRVSDVQRKLDEHPFF